MAILVILVLVILWAAVLLPPILRSRSESGSGGPSGIGELFDRIRSSFSGGRGADPALPPLTPIMGPVGPTGAPMAPGVMPPGAPMGPVRVPGGMTPVQRRRRDVLVALLAGAGFTLLMALFAGSIAFWVLHLLADGLLGGYVYLLLQYKARNASTERRPQPRPMEQPSHPTNVSDLAGRRPRLKGSDPTLPSHVDAPREATVLALRRTASW